MKINNLFTLTLLFVFFNASFGQEKKFKIHTIAFYNLENLFDTKNDEGVNDEEYTPANGWTEENYKKKLENLSRVLVQIGTDENPSNSPTIIGACEIENRGVLEDLVKHPRLIDKGYKIIHFDSPDKRGIDVALLYQEAHFIPTSYSSIPLMIYRDAKDNEVKKKKEEETEVDDDKDQVDEKSKRIYTRDQLLVTGYLDGEEVSFIVNHWPSRSGGEKKSSPNREAAGALNRIIMDSLFKINPKAKIITMGDLNDDPTNKSVKKGIGAVGEKKELKEFGIYNPMEKMHKQGIGTLGYRDAWNIFDQIMLSEAFVTPSVTSDYSTWTYWKANVYKKPFLIQTDGRWKGYPKRNSNGVPGFSDHLPVYVYLLKELNSNPIKNTDVPQNKLTKVAFKKNKEGKLEIPCTINGYATSFVYDAAVQNIIISGKEALVLLKSGKVKPENYKGDQPYSLSEGRILDGSTVFLETIVFNGLTLNNVTATVSNTINAPLIMGYKTLNVFGAISINEKENRLLFAK